MVAADIRVRPRLGGIYDAVGRIGIGHACGFCRMQLRYRTVVFPAVMGEAVVPEDVILHEGNALALDRVGNDHGGPVTGIVRIRQRGSQSVMVVAVQFNDMPAEGAPFRPQILQLQRLFTGVQTLHMVVVDDGHQILQPVVVGKQCRLPH